MVHVFCSSITPCSYPLIDPSYNFFAPVISSTSLEAATPQAVHRDLSQHLSPAILSGDPELFGITHISKALILQHASHQKHQQFRSSATIPQGSVDEPHFK